MGSLAKTLGGLALALLVLFGGLYYGAGRYFKPLSSSGVDVSGTQETALVNARAPYFDLPDLGGEHSTLTALNDKPLVLVFFATWNIAAADQIKILDDYIAANAKNNDLVRIVAIDTQEERTVALSFMGRGGYKVETLIDQSGATGEAYRIKSLPTSYFIDRDGVVRDAYSGILSEAALARHVEAILR